MRASPAVRGLRAAVFATLCVLLAAGGHALATGMAPPAWVQVAGFVPVFAGACLLGGRERSLVPIGAATLVAQGGLHLAFGTVRPQAVATVRRTQGVPAMGGSHGAVGVHGSPGGMTMRGAWVRHDSHGVLAAPGARMAHPHVLASHTAASHALMPHASVAHVSAAVLLTWWLRRGEAALFSLLRRAVTLVPGLAAWWRVLRGARCVPAVPRFVGPPADSPRALRRTLLRHAVQRRGPPTRTPYAI